MKELIKNRYLAHKETIHNFIWRSLQVFGKQGITFLIFILCAKLLTPYDFGIYNYVLTAIFLLIMFGDFGISTAASKYVAEYNFTDKNKLNGVLFNSGLIIFVLSILILVVTVIFGPNYFKDQYVYILYLLPLVFLAPMTSLYDGVYRGLKKFKKLALISLFVGFVSIFFVYYFVSNYGLIGALISQGIFYLLLLFCLAIGYREVNLKFSLGIIREIGLYSLFYGLAVVGNYLFNRFGILILGHYGYINEIATYELVNKILLVLLIPFVMLGQVVAPNFTEMGVKKEYSKIYSKLFFYTKVFLVTGIFLGVILYFIIPLLIRVFLPLYYNDLLFQMLPFIIIIFASNISTATIDAGIVIPTGFASLMAKFYLILGAFGCFLALILVKKIGYMGAIYSLTISNLIMIVGLRIFFVLRIKRLTSKYRI